jgi:Ser/Thr protein kinase RdoA (MazF antagonist)
VTHFATAVTSEEAADIARELYGIDAAAAPLPGERDLNFRLVGHDGSRYVLKLHHPDSDRDELDLQDAALLHIAARADAPPVPRVLPTRAGTAQGSWRANDGVRAVRLLSWLDGRPWADAGPHDAARMADLGRHVARVDAALADFRHPAMARPLLWNLTSAPTVAQWCALVPEPKREVVASVFARFDAFVAPRLAALPHQVIHNDANELNILVDDAGAVAGLIDFGDIVWSPRVCGVAVAGAYAMQGHDDPLRAVAPVVSGYQQVSPLGTGELEVLFDLMCTRLAMSVCMSAYQYANDPGNEYLLISQDGVWTVLRALARSAD